MFDVNAKNVNVDFEEVTKTLSKMSEEQLEKLEIKLDEEKEKRNIVKIARNFEENNDCVYLKIKSYTKNGEETYKLFAVDKYNRVLGFDRDKTSIMIGKINSNYKIKYISFDLEQSEINCFEGSIDKTTMSLQGKLYGNIYKIMIPDMQKYAHTRKIDLSMDVNYPYINKTIENLMQKFYEAVFYAKKDRSIFYQVYNIK